MYPCLLGNRGNGDSSDESSSLSSAYTVYVYILLRGYYMRVCDGLSEILRGTKLNTERRKNEDASSASAVGNTPHVAIYIYIY